MISIVFLFDIIYIGYWLCIVWVLSRRRNYRRCVRGQCLLWHRGARVSAGARSRDRLRRAAGSDRAVLMTEAVFQAPKRREKVYELFEAPLPGEEHIIFRADIIAHHVIVTDPAHILPLYQRVRRYTERTRLTHTDTHTHTRTLSHTHTHTHTHTL